MFKHSLICAALAASVSFASSAYALVGEVVEVTDGDTIGVLTEARQLVKVRLASIDAPEKGMPFGQAAKTALSALIFGKLVTVSEDTHDKYGRLIGIVTQENVNINEQMIKLGYAWPYCDTPNESYKCKFLNQRDWYFINEWEIARNERRGLWSQQVAEAPWDWRHNKKASDPRSASCQDFNSCDEAKAALAAGNDKIDGNHDGVPCEALCRPKK